MKIRFQSDDDLIGSNFQEDNKYYRQVQLH